MSADQHPTPSGECGPFAVDPRRTGPAAGARPGRAVGIAVWTAGVAVAGGAALATAHGLYEVAIAARVPAGIAWIYPLITDGLALLAYIATARLPRSGTRYAWTVVVLAAGLSGLAQASYLAADPGPGGVLAVSAALRFGVGAWPAIAAAIVAHLLYLLARPEAPSEPSAGPVDAVAPSPGERRSLASVQPAVFSPRVHTLNAAAFTPASPDGHDAAEIEGAGQRSPARLDATDRAASASAPAVEAPARDRALRAAERLARRSGPLPTVTEVENEARVSRGTAAAALKALRADPTRTAGLSEDPQTRSQP